MSTPLVFSMAFALISSTVAGGAAAMDRTALLAGLTPQAQQFAMGEGVLPLRGARLAMSLPSGPQHEACREVVTAALEAAGAVINTDGAEPVEDGFVIGAGAALPPLPERGPSPREAYVLAIGPGGIAARGASPAGLLYAAQTLRQLLRLSGSTGRLPCLQIADWPEFERRGVYIEGGQERFGRIVDADYLCEQIRRLSEFKMNTLIIECYNLFPLPSFPACADEGTLSPEGARKVVAEARCYHVVIIPSLQTLAQAWELVWGCEAGVPFREVTAPGLICPSTPAVYPFIKGLYRDLLTLFPDSPTMGVGCSEIDMQWQGRYCPKCQARVAAGETVRELLLGHAEKCIEAVRELSAELGRPIRPMIWADEFYMYGPGRDWVGLERIGKDTVMGYWKYWPDYAGIKGLMDRGYDVLAISAMYNHCFYLADLSPADPPKSWPSMARTGVVNITGLVEEADRVRRAQPATRFLGSATASFSKHRLRAFDSIWYGFALNGHCTWSHPERPLAEYQDRFTRAFVRHYYDARTDRAAEALASAYVRLDACKSQLELTNQTLHDVIGVYDTQEAGYLGNTLAGAFRQCGALSPEALTQIRQRAAAVAGEASRVRDSLEALRPEVGRDRELGDLWLAAEKTAAHAEREVLVIDAQRVRARPSSEDAERWAAHRARVERILQRTRPLYRRGDPCGLSALLREVAMIEDHLTRLAVGEPSSANEGPVLLEERFTSLDTTKWVLLGEPRIADGHLETKAPGGWERYCGLATREGFALDDHRPLLVEFELTPRVMGIDSQIVASAGDDGRLSYRFSFYGPRDRFGVYTQTHADPGSLWAGTGAGWRLRDTSMEVKAGSAYHVRLAITRRTFRAVVRELGDAAWRLPLWDSGPVPMDDLGETRLVFADVEPEGGTASSRWGPITIRQARAAR